MTDTTRPECGLCGAFGPWRRKGHADWCRHFVSTEQTDRSLNGASVGSTSGVAACEASSRRAPDLLAHL